MKNSLSDGGGGGGGYVVSGSGCKGFVFGNLPGGVQGFQGFGFWGEAQNLPRSQPNANCHVNIRQPGLAVQGSWFGA